MKKINKMISGVLAALMLFTSVPVYATSDVTSENTTEFTSLENSDTETATPETAGIENSINSIVEPNSDDSSEEIPLDNWSLDIVFYDSTVDNGKTPLQEIDWNAASKDETRVITMQINYKNTNTVTSYEPGELQIIVPNLGQRAMSAKSTANDDTSSGYGWRSYYELDAVTADKIDATNKENDWSYTEDVKETNEYNGQKYITNYIFTNNNLIEEKSNFEGSLQISYVFTASDVFQTENFKTHAILNNEIVSNDISFSFQSSKADYSTTTFDVLEPLISADGLPQNANNYIWVKYEMNMYHKQTRILNTFEYRIDVPQNGIVLDGNMELIEPDNNGNFTTNLIGNNVWSDTFFFIGYPKNEYEGQTISQTVELWGDYCDNEHSKETADNPKEMVKVFTINNINLDEFKFAYDGDATGITIHQQYANSTYNMITKAKAFPEFKVQFDATNPGYEYALKVGMDIFGITDTNQNFTFLKEDEYRITEITLDTPTNLNNTEYPQNSVSFDVYVRYKGETEFTKFGSYTNDNSSTSSKGVYFDNGEKDVVDFYVLYRNLTQGIQLRNNDLIRVYTEVYKKNDVPETGKIFGFGYIERYEETENGLVLKSSIDLDSYDSELTKNIIAPYDLEHYGHYVQRDFYEIKYENNDYLNTSIYNFVSSNTENLSKEQVEFSNRALVVLDADSTYVDYINGYKIYTLLPEGVILNGSDKDIIDSILLPYGGNYTKLKVNGINFESSDDFIQYIKNHTSIRITENWNNTNRTKIELDINLKNEPLYTGDFFGDDRYSSIEIQCTLPLAVSYDNLEEFGLVYQNYLYCEVYPAENYTPTPRGFNFNGQPCKVITDNGENDKQAVDINENGNTTEKLVASLGTTTINHVVASYQDVTLQVKSDISNYDTGTINTSANSEYTYKLRVRTGQNAITNLVIYDNLEQAYGNKKYWQGELLGVDTSYAENKGYTVKVWYSENEKAGTLSEDSSWKEYTDSIDKTKVKSLAFQYLNNEGNPATLPQASLTYVLINMRSPEDEALTTMAYNQINTEWNAIDDNGHAIDFITGINSNIVKVALPNSVDTEAGFSINFIKEILNQDNALATADDFEKLALSFDAPYDFMLKLTNTETSDIYNLVLNSKEGITISNLPLGTYTISEADDIFFDFVDMNILNAIDGVTFTNTDGVYTLTVTDAIESDNIVEIKIQNKLAPTRSYVDKDSRLNLFDGTPIVEENSFLDKLINIFE